MNAMDLLPDAAFRAPDGGFWVFGYGSLMWRPGFAFAERRDAWLTHYQRSFCMWSVHYRGTPEDPGLVLALAERAGARTHGVAYRVAPPEADAARRYLAERELVSSAYRETVVALGFENGTSARALTYVVDPEHAQCALHLTVEEQAAVIARAVGPMGPNTEYLFNTTEHLRACGLSETEMGDLPELERLVRAQGAG